ncbi:neurexin-1-alpha, partial [Plakobranchus ocellatus]
MAPPGELPKTFRLGFVILLLAVFTTDYVASEFPGFPEDEPTTGTNVTLMTFNGISYMRFNFSLLENLYFDRAVYEDFKFHFATLDSDGLIMLHQYAGRKIYFFIRNGQLVMVDDDGRRSPREITLGGGKIFNDGNWHFLLLRRQDKTISVTVDGENRQTYTFPRDIQFLVPAQVYFGATENTVASTGGRVSAGFRGTMVMPKPVFSTYTQAFVNNATRNYRNGVSLFNDLGENGATNTGVDIKFFIWHVNGTIGPKPVPLAVTAITLTDPNAYIKEKMDMRHGSSIDFKFRTIGRQSILLHVQSNIYQKNFFLLEIYDGKLRMIHNFNKDTKASFVSDSEVSDGQTHQVVVRFLKDAATVTLDGRTKKVDLEPGETLPQISNDVYLGGTLSYKLLPWHSWAREGYRGCLEDVIIDGRTVDFGRFANLQQLTGRVSETCLEMPKPCSEGRRCANGFCMNKWGTYECDCRATDYMGNNCGIPAWTGLFDGFNWFHMKYESQVQTHVNDMSFRFKTMAKDGLIFQTKAEYQPGFIRAELEDGRMKVTSNLGGEVKTLYTGNNLNDMEWHTVYIQRRGNRLQIWVDKEDMQKVDLPGAGYFLHLDDVLIGGYTPEDNLNIPADTKRFIGYMRNFYIDDIDIFKTLNLQGTEGLYQFPNIPSLVFNDITIPSYNSYIKLQGLSSLDKLNMHFVFKTNEPSGVIFFNEGARKDMFGVELFEGRLHVKLDTPGNEPVNTITPRDKRYDDGKWHSVSITHKLVGGQRQLMLTVDGLRTPYSVAGIEDIGLQGELYVGGIPSTYFQKDYIDEFLASTTGYRGCLASVDLGRGPPDLRQAARLQGITIYDSCKAILSQCSEPGNECYHGGICHDNLNNGTTWCDCSHTGWGGRACADHPLGYYFRSDGIPDQYAMMVYTYPTVKTTHTERDEIVFGVMTDELDATLVKLISGIFDDFIEFKLVNGFLRVEYDTDGQGAIKTIRNDKVYISDGNYHIVRFIRTKNNASLIIDEGEPVLIYHATAHGDFDRLEKIFVGGVYQSGGIVDGTGFRGIIGGLNINGHMVFYDASKNLNTAFLEDVIIAPRPYELFAKIVTPSDTPWESDPTPPPVIPPIFPNGIPILPPDIGGAGIGWTVGGGGGVDVVVFPDGSGGSAGAVPGGLPPAGAGPVAAAQVAAVPSLPAVGPRAGALMGTLLGLAVLASSLMWAFYRCKPGCCGAGAGGGGAPMSISAPRASASNIGAVQAASAANAAAAGAGAGAAAGGAGGAGSRSAVAANGGSASYFGQSTLINGQSSSAVHQRTDSYDSATLRAMGTFSNRGTALGTPGASRHQFSSTSGYSESNMVVTPGSMQSYQFENANPDYDVATGVHSNYNANTLTAGGANAGGFSSSTMSSNYNYSVKTIKTVGAQQQLLGYNAGSLSNVIVTPGAMGEEIRVDCCLMTNDGHSVVTGSSLGPPQVWNMSNGELLRIMQGETVGSTYLHLVNGDRLLVGAINADLEVNQYSVPKGVHNYVFQIWDFSTGRPLDMAERETLSALTLMNDSDKVLFGRSDKFGGGTNIIIWDLMGNQPLKEMRYDAPVGNNDYISYINISQ